MPTGAGLTDEAGSYDLYFAAGHYDRRYPAPNPATLARVLAALPEDAHVIDFGCGSGRYLLPLAPHVRIAAGFDVSPAALQLLRQRAAGSGIVALGPRPEDLDAHVARHGPADMVLCLFGVLAHLQGRERRVATLRHLRKLLAPKGRLMISVPNRRRRFRREQRAAAATPGDIRYLRRFGGDSVALSYHLYDPHGLADELAAAGFRIETLSAESVLPESLILRGASMRVADAVLRRLCPAALGYGILALVAPDGVPR